MADEDKGKKDTGAVAAPEAPPATAEPEQPAEPEQEKAGRPLKFSDPKALAEAIDSYFANCDPHTEYRRVENGVDQKGFTIWIQREIMTEQQPYTLSGLARHLEVDRSTLLHYQKPEHYPEDISDEVRQELIRTVVQAKARCEEYAETQLFNGNANGARFNLTNNYRGWREKTEQDITSGGKPIPILGALADVPSDDSSTENPQT